MHVAIYVNYAGNCEAAFRFYEQLFGGRVTTLSFGDYKIPSMGDVPPLKTVLLPAEDGVGPYHVKGIGENSNTPVAAAIANAVADAIGVRVRDLPITAERVYRALHAAKDE